MIFFEKISSIELDNNSSWKEPAFLTFDIDWCHNDVLAHSIDLLEKYDVAATWFVTHDTPLLQRLRENPKFELGIHPNFNFLLKGDSRNGANAEEVVNRLLELVPEAKSVRSHSMTQSSVLQDLFVEMGLVFECNYFVPHHVEINLRPYRLWNGLVKVPYCWEDDVYCLYGLKELSQGFFSRSTLKVLDFHPIHVFLNTQNLSLYENTRPIHREPIELILHRNQGYGTNTFLQGLLRL